MMSPIFAASAPGIEAKNGRRRSEDMSLSRHTRLTSSYRVRTHDLIFGLQCAGSSSCMRRYVGIGEKCRIVGPVIDWQNALLVARHEPDADDRDRHAKRGPQRIGLAKHHPGKD